MIAFRYLNSGSVGPAEPLGKHNKHKIKKAKLKIAKTKAKLVREDGKIAMVKQDLVKELEAFEGNLKWIDEHYDALKNKYPDQWVAVFNKKVVGNNKNLKKIIRKLKESFPQNYDHVATEYISTKKIELILGVLWK
jgi:hypothetical protein